KPTVVKPAEPAVVKAPEPAVAKATEPAIVKATEPTVVKPAEPVQTLEPTSSKTTAAAEQTGGMKDLSADVEAPAKSDSDPNIEPTLHISEKRAQQIRSGEKDFAIDRALT